jgi:cell wall-associated NlpC family hydrolase
VLFAPHYARAEACRCIADAVTVHAAPSREARATSQLVYGEDFEMIDKAGGWAWGRCAHDDYVGYVRADALGPLQQAPTHRVIAPLALVFANPDIKAPVAKALPVGARFAGEEDGNFLRMADGYIHLRHVAAVAAVESDPVAVAQRMLGMPYRWGGRGGDGIDCSGLVQRALELAGIAAPRDSDMQRDQLGEMLAEDALLRRGDLIFFPGHVGMMVDADQLIHANAFWMSTMIEPLADVVERLKPTHAQPITARKRI